MRKILIAFASLAVMVGLVGSAEAGTSVLAKSQTTHAPSITRALMNAKLAKIEHSKRLTRGQLRALGLKPVSRQQAAALNRLRSASTSKGEAKAATAGCTYWYTWHNAGNSWVDRYYCGPYYSYPWYPYYYLYDNFKTCTYAGGSCIAANAYTYYYYGYYYPYQTWYTYGSSGGGGYGPYSG